MPGSPQRRAVVDGPIEEAAGILEVDPQADAATIKSAYKRAARVAHPDMPFGSKRAMQAVNDARDLLLKARGGA